MRRIALLAALALAPAEAHAATFCVDIAVTGCVERPTVAAALASARVEPGLDTIRVGRRLEDVDVTDAAGEPIRLIGNGRRVTEIEGRVDLGEDRSSAANVAVREPSGIALAVRGIATGVDVEGRVRLRDGSALRSSSVEGPLVTAGQVTMHSVAIAGTGIDVESGTLTANHLTVSGIGAVGLRVPPGAQATVANSVLWGFLSGVTGPVTTTFSHLPETGVAPGFVAAGDLRLGPGSPLIDAGDPRPLEALEPETDALGDVRATDGDGDGIARRDVGALERRPPPPPSVTGNLLANPGAEQGTAVADDTSSPAPPRWRRTGGFTSVRYGTVVGTVTEPIAFPTLEVSAALGAGDAFFAGGPSGAASATQVVDVSRWAPEIDGRSGVRMRLSALLGGFRKSDDRAVVTAQFRGPSGDGLGRIALDDVTAAERANATMLLPRAAGAAVPRLTRSIAVSVRSGTPGGSYNDAYVDDVALVPQVPGLPGVPTRRTRAGRPFAGVVVISRRVRVARGRARVRVACPSGTVRRCAGIVTLARRRFVILGSRQVSMRSGGSRRVRIPLSQRERRRLRRRSRGHVYTAVRDAQGLTRTATAPVRIVRH